MQEAYMVHTSGLNPVSRLLFRATVPYVRNFDFHAAQRVDHFIANSRFVAERILKCYGKKATVIHPPVNIADFQPDGNRDDFYLIVSELVPYKRIDLAVDAFNHLGKKLVVIGGGSELEALRSRAKPNITFLGRQPEFVLKYHYEHCRAFLMPGIEDFGITPLEAQSAGAPVIAYGEGGTLETVIEGKTGRFFREQTPQSLVEAVGAFEQERHQYLPSVARRQAEKFSPARFRKQMKAFLLEKYPHLFEDHEWADEPPREIKTVSGRIAAKQLQEAA
jgi:glycosyltransferase involved in cell wall biosynthesis